MDSKDAEEQLIESTDLSNRLHITNTPLPRDIFKNKILYDLQFRKRFYCGTLLVLALWLGITSWIASIDVPGAIVFGFFSGIFLPFLIPIYMQTTNMGWDDRSVRSFMIEIIKVSPGDNMAKWDAIAAEMNPVFHANSRWATPYFFYDGQCCQSRFTNRFVLPYLKEQKNFSPVVVPFVKAAVDKYMEHFNAQLQQMTMGSSTD
ncbi:LAME_0C01552g1_1 [Lachancea meyersii CBS 8951]|uniref:LAME_0C01552g1_1 n=1 Tax=Lachancea meyersii CBS 8951 TaxID=1266667 RepID=A0A1G4IZE1_9SACH|nr:LAME_0C01552g1_1 [Lachancea meyersii CBS 8951]